MTERDPEGPARNPTFLERNSYRNRRLVDAARALPALGLFGLMLPLFWRVGEGETTTAWALIYLFGLWAVLILAAAVLVARLSKADGDGMSDEGAGR